MIMRKILLLLLLLSITGVYANQPTPETACCMSFQDGWTLTEECDQFEINRERCDKIVAQYKSLDSGFLGWDSIIPLMLLTAGLIFALWWIWIKPKKKK